MKHRVRFIEIGTVRNSLIINREMSQAAAWLEEFRRAWRYLSVPVDRRLFICNLEAVRQFGSEQRQPVKEEAKVYAVSSLIRAVWEPRRHAESVRAEQPHRSMRWWSRETVEQRQAERPVGHTAPHHVRNAPVGDLPAKRREKRPTSWATWT